MSERRWGKWTRDGVPKRWWQSMHRYTDKEVLAEMPMEVIVQELQRRRVISVDVRNGLVTRPDGVLEFYDKTRDEWIGKEADGE